MRGQGSRTVVPWLVLEEGRQEHHARVGHPHGEHRAGVDEQQSVVCVGVLQALDVVHASAHQFGPARRGHGDGPRDGPTPAQSLGGEDGDRRGQMGVQREPQVDLMHVVVDDIVGQDSTRPQEDEGPLRRMLGAGDATEPPAPQSVKHQHRAGSRSRRNVAMCRMPYRSRQFSSMRAKHVSADSSGCTGSRSTRWLLATYRGHRVRPVDPLIRVRRRQTDAPPVRGPPEP